MVLGPLLFSLGPWLEGAVVPFILYVLLFFPGIQRCGDRRERPLCAWGSASSKVAFSQGTPMVQEFRLVFGLAWTLQPISGCFQSQCFILWQLSFSKSLVGTPVEDFRNCRCIKSLEFLHAHWLSKTKLWHICVTPLVFRKTVLIPLHYIYLYLMILLFITASNNLYYTVLYHTATIVVFILPYLSGPVRDCSQHNWV